MQVKSISCRYGFYLHMDFHFKDSPKHTIGRRFSIKANLLRIQHDGNATQTKHFYLKNKMDLLRVAN